MTARGTAVALTAMICTAFGLASGGRIFYLTALFCVLALSVSLLCMIWTKITMSTSVSLTQSSVPRGKKCSLRVSFGRRGPMPLIPCLLTVRYGNEKLYFSPEPLFTKCTSTQCMLPTMHVGAFEVCADTLKCGDLLGLFRFRFRLPHESETLLVLPRAFDAEVVRYAAGDDGAARPNKAAEDAAYPDGIRAYQTGDPLKRIHWKLTARRGELISRQFQTPAPPDTLILMDCTAPGDAAHAADLTDALCETVLSAAEIQLAHDSPVRVPLYGASLQEFRSAPGGDTQLLREMLACVSFTGGESFSRVLGLELRSANTIGAEVLVTSSLDAGLVEAVRAVRSMGPSVRVYLITMRPDDPEYQSCVSQLLQCGTEVCYVTPSV